MNSNQILLILSIVAALGATVVPDVMPYWPLALIVLGLVNGFMNPMADAATRVAYTVAAIAIPTLADGLDAIPVAGAYLNSIIDNLMVAVAGAVIANFILVVINQVKGSD
ncbi:MAG: hypothetical protein HON77_13130 [Gammaproteobacteria bacterium]|jgi:hypothetical protein|nr:hypothetical protein [Gammaproteobacteria bacterium]MBT7876490.1 hypothetical protein [Gammaproteobacteria bacterium]MDG1234082.1 hypothetical protein [Pseudomonadales bacterium]